MDIKSCLDSVAPYEIVNQKLIKDMIDIFVEFINEKANINVEIDNTYVGENKVIDMELVKIYLNDIYTILTSIQMNPDVIRALDKFAEYYPKAKYVSLLTETADNIISTESDFNLVFYSEADLDNDDTLFTDGLSELGTERLIEYLYTAKAFKQRKGTTSALKYGYNLIRQSGIQESGTTDAVTDTLFDVQFGTEENPNEPFYFRISGSLIPEVYENAVVPIVHPLGFGYDYVRLMKLVFLELGLVKEEQSNYNVRIVCNNGEYGYPINAQDIIFINKEYDDFGDVKITVALKDDAEIAQGYEGTNFKIVRDYTSLVYLMDGFDNILVSYPEFCALFTDYDVKYISGINEQENIIIDYNLNTDIVPVPLEPYFGFDTWCLDETYIIVTEDEDFIISERYDYTFITCTNDSEQYDSDTYPTQTSDGGTSTSTYSEVLDGGTATSPYY